MGFFKSAFVKVGSVAKQQAIYPFISALPLANSLPSFFTRVKGSVSHAWPFTGTTSVCPDNITPPSTAGPILQCKEALVSSLFGTKVVATPKDSIYSFIQWIILRLLSPPKTGK